MNFYYNTKKTKQRIIFSESYFATTVLKEKSRFFGSKYKLKVIIRDIAVNETEDRFKNSMHWERESRNNMGKMRYIRGYTIMIKIYLAHTDICLYWFLHTYK